MITNNEIKRSTILIVDDAPINLAFLTRILGKSGFNNVISAENGERALQLLHRSPPALVLLDIVMPGMDGFDLYGLIRKNSATSDIPIIFISALSDRESIERGFNLGAVDYITKPFNSAEVIGRVTTHLRLKSYSDDISTLLERNSCLLNSAGEGIMGVDANSHVTYINPYAESLLGYRAEELKSINLHHVIYHSHADGREFQLEESPIMKVIKHGGVEYVEDDLFFSKKGEPLHVEYTVSKLSRRFNIDECIIVFRDISEKRQVEKQLKEAATVFELSSDGIVLTETDGTILRVNPAFSSITGYEADEVVGKNPRLLKSDHHGEEFYDEMWSILATEGYWEGEIWNRDKGGKVFPEWQRIRAIQDHNNKTIGYVSQFSDITRRKLTEEEIRYRGNYDALTGLANRSLLTERILQSVKEHRRNKKKLGLLYLDLDKFKQVNDTLGHAIGDQLLVEASRRITQELRDFDTAARLGGDEFVVMMTDIEGQVPCEVVASRLIASLGRPFELGEHVANIGASIGIALYPEDGNTMELLMRNADLALYRSKENGRGQVQFFTEAMEREYLERSQMEMDLTMAIERNQLSLKYQPIIDLQSGETVGVESLLRWNHPNRGEISPAQFVPVAEGSNLINRIGLWVFETACQQLSEWRQQGLSLYASINVSTRQIPNSLTIDRITQLMDKYQVDPSQLVIEITENVFVHNMEIFSDWLGKIRKLGIAVYLDDFGTGYSSLLYLKQFTVDAVKIDRAFINELMPDSRDVALVKAVLLMCDELEIKVIAEGLETREHLELLKGLNCPYAQGYLFSRPVAASLVANASYSHLID